MMRRVLVDAARARRAVKRGEGIDVLPLDDVDVAASERHVNVVALEEALERLGAVNPRAAQVVELRFFGGFSVEETAEAIGVSVRTVPRSIIPTSCACTTSDAWTIARTSSRSCSRPSAQMCPSRSPTSSCDAPLVGKDRTRLDLAPETPYPPFDEIGVSWVGQLQLSEIIPGPCPSAAASTTPSASSSPSSSAAMNAANQQKSRPAESAPRGKK